MTPVGNPFYTVPLIRLTIGESVVYKLMLETQNVMSQLDIGPSYVTNAPTHYVNYSRLDDLIEEPPYMITFANLLGQNGRLLAMPYSTEKEHDYHKLLGKRCISHDLTSDGLELPGLKVEFIRPSHFAVLFGYGDDLCGTENDIQRLGRELAYRGFQLAYFHGETASKENILDAIRYATRSSPNKQIAVIGSGHGNVGFIGIKNAFLECCVA
jgi:hypothetical protein